MKWEGNRESDNVEDRRSGGGSGGGFSGGGLGGLLGALLGSKLGVGTIFIALLGSWALGINPLTILGLLSGEGAPTAQVQQAPAQRPPVDDQMARFVSTVLADTEDVWTEVRPLQPAGRVKARWGRFIALRIERSISISAFTKPCRSSWALRATLPRPM
jgi:predicted metalloprotease